MLHHACLHVFRTCKCLRGLVWQSSRTRLLHLIYSQTPHTPFTSRTRQPLSAGHHRKTKPASKQNAGDRCNYSTVNIKKQGKIYELWLLFCNILEPALNTKSKIMWPYKMQCKFIFVFNKILPSHKASLRRYLPASHCL